MISRLQLDGPSPPAGLRWANTVLTACVACRAAAGRTHLPSSPSLDHTTFRSPRILLITELWKWIENQGVEGAVLTSQVRSPQKDFFFFSDLPPTEADREAGRGGRPDQVLRGAAEVGRGEAGGTPRRRGAPLCLLALSSPTPQVRGRQREVKLLIWDESQWDKLWYVC